MAFTRDILPYIEQTVQKTIDCMRAEPLNDKNEATIRFALTLQIINGYQRGRLDQKEGVPGPTGETIDHIIMEALNRMLG